MGIQNELETTGTDQIPPSFKLEVNRDTVLGVSLSLNTQMCVSISVCTCLWKLEVNLRCCSSGAITLYFETESLSSTYSFLIRWVGWPASDRILPFPPLFHWDYKCVLPCPQLFVWVLGIEPWFSCLHSRHCTNLSGIFTGVFHLYQQTGLQTCILLK